LHKSNNLPRCGSDPSNEEVADRMQVIRFLYPMKKSPGAINARRFTDNT
jgi:hypothetical protein